MSDSYNHRGFYGDQASSTLVFFDIHTADTAKEREPGRDLTLNAYYSGADRVWGQFVFKTEGNDPSCGTVGGAVFREETLCFTEYFLCGV